MGGIINYLLIRIASGRAILAASSHGIIPDALNLAPKRRLTTQASSSSSKYDLFFPSFYREHVCNIIDWYTSIEKVVEPPDASLDESVSYNPVHKHPITCPNFEDKPHYIYDDDFNDPIIIQKGNHFDVISLLSDDLVRIGSSNVVKSKDLMGKYILLVSAFIPSIWIDSYNLRALSLLSNEMSRLHIGRNNFEIVIVPKMRQKWDNDEGVFNHFFSAFPGCLTLPFTHKYRRDYICKSLKFEGPPRCIFVDPSQKVVQVGFQSIVQYGARGFPFSDECFASVRREDKWTEPCSPSNKSLAGLLGCESSPSSLLLHKFDSEETISVEQLNKHHVGLYMFTRGYMLKDVQNIYQQCRDQGLDLEIVLVYLPFYTSIDPEVYQDVVHCVLKKHQVSNWWVFPFNNSACRRLEELRDSSCSDSLFIVGPNNKFVDRQAGEVLGHFGVHFGTQAYPFTMEGLLQAFLQRLDTVTLESFFTFNYVYQNYECDDSKRIPVSELKGKNILVYVSDTSSFKSEWENECEDVIWWYNIIKEKDSDFDVIFVPVFEYPDFEYPKDTSKVRKCIFESKTRWLVCPFDDPKQSKFLMNHDAFLLSSGLFCASKGLSIPSVLAFGKDGHLHSLQALRLLNHNGLDAYPFLRESRIRNLREEVSQKLLYEFELYDDTTVSL